MAKNIYIHSSGSLKRKENTLRLELQDGTKRVIPINDVSAIFVFGELELNKRVLEFLTTHKVAIHFFNRYGYYVGSYYPREYLNSGLMTLKQAEHYFFYDKRLYLARSFVEGGLKNILKTLKYYRSKRGKSELETTEGFIKAKIEDLKGVEYVEQIMQIEGSVREEYYKSWKYIIENPEFVFEKREKRPPTNEINALISFGNSLVYTLVLSEIYHTYLDPRIGYLHETNRRSFSLNLDIAEIFKPILVDRVIFTLINRGLLKPSEHFEEAIGNTYLTEKGRKIFIKQFEDKLKTTFKHPTLGRVSYKRLIRLECYKLYKHFLGEKEYQPLVV